MAVLSSLLLWALPLVFRSAASEESSSSEEWWADVDAGLAAEDADCAYAMDGGLIYPLMQCMRQLDAANDYATYSAQYLCRSNGNFSVAFRQEYSSKDCDAGTETRSEMADGDFFCEGSTAFGCYASFRSYPSKSATKCQNAGGYEDVFLVTGECVDGTTISCSEKDKTVTIMDYWSEACNDTQPLNTTTYEKGCNKRRDAAFKVKMKSCGDKKFKSGGGGSSGGLPVGAIIGIAVGGAVVVAVIGFLVFKRIQAKDTDGGGFQRF